MMMVFASFRTKYDSKSRPAKGGSLTESGWVQKTTAGQEERATTVMCSKGCKEARRRREGPSNGSEHTPVQAALSGWENNHK